MPRISALIIKACLSGCTVAVLFVLADASTRMQLQQAVMVSRIDLKPAAEILRAKPRPLDKHRLAATIAMIGSLARLIHWGLADVVFLADGARDRASTVTRMDWEHFVGV